VVLDTVRVESHPLHFVAGTLIVLDIHRVVQQEFGLRSGV
jgi:hypothetical protein